MIKKIFCAMFATLLSVSTAQADSPRIWASLGAQIDYSAAEAQVRYMGEPIFWGLQPVVSASFARNSAAWVGVGSAITWRAAESGVFARFTSMLGVHRRGNGPDLGGPIQLRNAFDVGLMTKSGAEFGIGVDHRSNAGLYRPNPGINTAYLFASFPLH